MSTLASPGHGGGHKLARHLLRALLYTLLLLLVFAALAGCASMKDLQDKFGFSYVFISRDLALVRFISDEVLVMKDGMAVEQVPTAQILAAPREDYTKRPLAAIPQGYRAAA